VGEAHGIRAGTAKALGISTEEDVDRLIAESRSEQRAWIMKHCGRCQRRHCIVGIAFDRPTQTPYTEKGILELVLPMTITVKNKTPLVVPPAVRRQAGLKSGDRLEFKVSGRVITILPKPSAADDEYTAAERRAIDHGITQSEKEYGAGKSYGPFETADEAIASLNASLRRRSAAAKKLKSVSR
jgi:bifunctional DNA-binding transcriptional regulator/antitoxin component of YhaV-PrlF toxin-antitoxin module